MCYVGLCLIIALFDEIGLQIGDSDSGRLPDGVHLNHVKWLARTFNAASSQSNSQTQSNKRIIFGFVNTLTLIHCAFNQWNII